MDLFSDLTNYTKLSILKSLNDSSKTLSELASRLNLSKPEISRQLSELNNLKLIERIDRQNHLSIFGETILNCIFPLEFLIDHFEFFKNHPLPNLPMNLVRDICDLQYAELIEGAGLIVKNIIDRLKKHNQEIYLMVDHPQPRIADVKIDKVLVIAPIYAKDENLNLDFFHKDCKEFEIRTLEVVEYNIMILDHKIGLFLLPNLKGVIDANYAFFVTDPLGINYLERVWDFFWKKSKFRVASKL